MCWVFFCAGGGGTSPSSRMLHNSNMHILASYCLFASRSHSVFAFFFVCSSSAISRGWNHTWSVSRFLPAENVTSPHVPSRTADASGKPSLLSSVFSFFVFRGPSFISHCNYCVFVCLLSCRRSSRDAAQINSLPWQAARPLYIPGVISVTLQR